MNGGKRMKFKLIIFIGLILVLFVSGCTTEEYKIGVLDMEQVLMESKRAEQLSDELTQISNDLEQQYQENRDNEEETNNIYQQFLGYQQEYENKLREEINLVLEEIKEQENLQIIIYKQSVKEGGINITDQVVEQLDAGFVKNDTSP